MSGRPRGGTPYIERRPSGQVRYRREVPRDLQHILGEAWIFTFPPGTPAETVKASAEALTNQYDKVIEERRARMASMTPTAAQGG